MGKNNRREVAKSLTEAIKNTKDDPETLIRLATQLSKVLPKRRRVSKPLEEPKPVTRGPKSTYVLNGSALDRLPLGEQTLHRLVMGVEAAIKKYRREQSRDVTEAEKSAMIEQTLKAFSDEERAALEAYNPDGV